MTPQYVVIQALSSEKMVELVNQALVDGYKLVGGLSVCSMVDDEGVNCPLYSQAAIKTPPVAVANPKMMEMYKNLRDQ